MAGVRGECHASLGRDGSGRRTHGYARLRRFEYVDRSHCPDRQPQRGSDAATVRVASRTRNLSYSNTDSLTITPDTRGRSDA